MIELKGPVRPAAAFALATVLSLSAVGATARQAEGEIVIVQPTAPPNSDPGDHAYSHTGPIIYQNVIETVNLLDLESGEMSPQLATEWGQTGDTTYFCTLREGVVFHDGTPFNVDAVVYSIDRLVNTDVGAMARNKDRDHMTASARKLKGYRVELTGSQPEPLFFTRLSHVPIVSPDTPMNEITRNPVGTGPCKLVEWEPGVRIVLEPFDEHWGEEPEVTKASYSSGTVIRIIFQRYREMMRCRVRWRMRWFSATRSEPFLTRRVGGTRRRGRCRIGAG